MKNLVIKMKNKAERAYIRAKNCLAGKVGEGYVDFAVKVIISVVIGGLLLGGMYTLFNTTVIPSVTEKITDMFSYTP